MDGHGGAGDGCPHGHVNREGIAFCTTCGEALPVHVALDHHEDAGDLPGARPNRSWIFGLVAVLALVAVAVAAYGLGRQGGEKPAPADAATSPSTASSTPSSTTTSTSTSTSTSTTAQPSTTQEVAPTAAETARSAAVVYWTYGVTATGYPTFEEVIAPSARPAVESMILGADYRNAGCTQIVSSITNTSFPDDDPSYHRFTAELQRNCPAGATGFDGAPLGPLTETLYLGVITAPKPGGGWWATEMQTDVFD